MSGLRSRARSLPQRGQPRDPSRSQPRCPARGRIAQETPPPEWVKDFSLPNEKEPLELIKQYDEELEETRRKRDETLGVLATEIRFRKLLYETGEDALEPVVRDAFRELGTEVTDLAVKGRDDGRMTGPAGSLLMLEIKGRTKTLKLSDVRELDQWVRDELPESDYKGILVANLMSGERPGARNDIFPPNAVLLAERAGICPMTTTQLFRALQQHQAGELDTGEFFATIGSTSGVCQLPELSDGQTEPGGG